MNVNVNNVTLKLKRFRGSNLPLQKRKFTGIRMYPMVDGAGWLYLAAHSCTF